MSKTQSIITEDILLTLCRSVIGVLSAASASQIRYSAMVQKIHKTCLKPDLGCFVLFDGGFSGLVVINFTAPAAMELYQKYMSLMGMPAGELATRHTSDDVSNVLGELMNQIVGDVTGKVREELYTSITQNQLKMLAINKQVIISIDTNLDRPQACWVTFTTEGNNIFYLELAMDKTEFFKLHDVEPLGKLDADSLIGSAAATSSKAKLAPAADTGVDQDLLDALGL